MLTLQQLYEKRDELENKGEFYTYNKNMNGLCSVASLRGNYGLDNDYMNACNQFELDTGLINCKLDDIHDAEISNFVRNGVHYNGTIDFDECCVEHCREVEVPKDMNHCDMTKGHTV